MTDKAKQTLHRILDAYLDKYEEQMDDGSFFTLSIAGHVEKVDVSHMIISRPDEHDNTQIEYYQAATAYWDKEYSDYTRFEDVESEIKAMRPMSWDEYRMRGGKA